MTDLAEREVAEEGSLEIAIPEINPENAQRARSVTLPSPASLAPVTQRVRSAGAKAASLLEKPGTLPHSQPPTFVQAYARHRECAAHFKTPLFRWLRMQWGWFHLLIVKPALNALEHYTASPLAALIVAAIVVAIWFWS